MKRIFAILLAIALGAGLCACSAEKGGRSDVNEYEAMKPRAVLVLDAGERHFYLSEEENAAAEAFFEKLDAEPLVLTAEDGDLGKVAELPWELPRSDAEIKAAVGDVVLDESGRLVICYEAVEGSMTRLARMHSASKETLAEAIGEGTAEVSFYLEWSE